MNEKIYEELLRDGITAAKNGKPALARKLLERAVKTKSGDARPWLWLSETTDDPQEKRKFLEYAVAAEPGNVTARRSLVLLSEKLDRSRLVPEGVSVEPRCPVEPEDAKAQAYLCPGCGGRMSFDLEKNGLACQYCGYLQLVENQPAADSAEEPIDFILPTTRAHRWVEARQRVSCVRCGAVNLLPPNQVANRCSYCGSNRLIEASQAAELVDPQAILPMKVSERQAVAQVRKWLGKGLFSPDDLTVESGRLQLRPAYYPFWTFDGTMEIPWSCEVNLGTGNNPNWVKRSASEFELFDDVLVSGLTAFSAADVSAIEPFKLKEVVEFKPDYLVGWTALSYDRTLADASLLANEKVIGKARASLSINVEPGYQKRNLTSGAGKWSGLTYKYIMLPLWVGSYQYQEKIYRFLVNGQTGKVGGEKPQDQVKMFLLGAIIVIAVVILGLLLAWLPLSNAG